MVLTIHWEYETRQGIKVDSFKEASELFIKSRDAGYHGASAMMAACGRISENGKQIAYVAYNGKVMPNRPQQWTPDTKPLYVPEGKR